MTQTTFEKVIIAKSEVTADGCHYQIEEIAQNMYTVSGYLDGKIQSTSKNTRNIETANKKFHSLRGKSAQEFNNADAMIEEKTVVRHKFFRMGSGGGFRLISLWSAPSRAVLEQNPRAYNIQMSMRPKCCRFQCDHCGMPIEHHYILKDSNGDTFSVGSSCVEKVGQEELITQAKAIKLEADRKKRQEAREKRNEERRLAQEAEFQAQRDRNGGLTDYEVKIKKREEAHEAFHDLCFEVSRPIVKMLKAAGGNFCLDVAQQLREGRIPSNNAKRIVIEIMAKQKSGSRKGSKAYQAAHPEAEELFNSVEEQINNARPEFSPYHY